MDDNKTLEAPSGALPSWAVAELRDFLELYRAAPEGRLRILVFVKLCELVEGLVRDASAAKWIKESFPRRDVPSAGPPVVALYACQPAEWPPEMTTVVYSVGFPGEGPGMTTSASTILIEDDKAKEK